MRRHDHIKLKGLAARLLADEPALNCAAAFGPGVSSGLSSAPALMFEDHSEISLFDESADVPLEYRALLLAGDGDTVLVGGRRHRAFETYCRDRLRLGTVDVIRPRPPSKGRFVPLSRRCAADADLLDRLCHRARRHGEFNIVPYIGTGNAWRLARLIASRTSAKVHVAAAAPRLTRRVNDKLWFAQRVREVLEKRALPPSFSVFGPAALSARVAACAARFDRVVVKVPDSAGSLGNVVFRSTDVAKWPLADLRARILDILRERGWRGSYPLLVGVWDHPVIESPSINIWIPMREHGPPIIEGVFTQMLSGTEGEFIGAAPSTLPAEWQQRIAREATALACLFQELGYFGRCGLDAILIGESLETAELHWIECNGRWGGVSTPLTLANRLVGNWRRKGLVVVQRTRVSMPPRSFDSILALLGDRLLNGRGAELGVVLLVPGRMVDGSGMNLMVLAETQAAAHRQAESIANVLLSDVQAV